MIRFLEDNIIYYKILYILYGILSVTILREVPFFTNIFSMSMVILSFIYFCIFIYRGYYKQMNKMRYLLVLFLIIQCSTFFISKNYISDIIRLVFNGIYFLIISNNTCNHKKDDINKIFKIILPIICTIMVISIIMYLFNISININNNIYGRLPESDYYKSFVGVTVNSNTIGILASFLFIMALHLRIFNKKNILLNYICMLLSGISLFISQSRGAILMLLIYIITLITLINKNKKYIRLFISTIIVVFIGIIIYYLSKHNIDTVSTGRSILWENAFNLIKENKIFGVGTTSFIDVMKESSSVYLPGIDKGGLHNIYIQIALANGLLAFCIFIIFIFLSIVIFIKRILFSNIDYSNKINMSLFSILISILSLNLFESTLIYICSFIALIFWICIGELYVNLDLE